VGIFLQKLPLVRRINLKMELPPAVSLVVFLYSGFAVNLRTLVSLMNMHTALLDMSIYLSRESGMVLSRLTLQLCCPSCSSMLNVHYKFI